MCFRCRVLWCIWTAPCGGGTIFQYVSGVGFCGVFGPPLVVVGQYFNVRRSFANGLATAGGSLGQLTVPLFTRFLFDTYGYVLLYYGIQ